MLSCWFVSISLNKEVTIAGSGSDLLLYMLMLPVTHYQAWTGFFGEDSTSIIENDRISIDFEPVNAYWKNDLQLKHTPSV